jgi:hypothetical protein
MSQTALFRTKEGRIVRKAAKMSAEEIAEDLGKKAKPGMQLSVTEVAYAYLGGSSTSTSPVARKAMEILVQKGKAKATGKKNLGNAAIYEITASARKAESGDAAAYKAYFEKKLKEWGIKSPADLDDAKKKKFFNEVDDGWTSDDEKKGSPPPDADVTCGCGCSGGTRHAAAATLATAKALVKKFAQGLETEVDSSIISIFYNLDTRNKAKKAAGAISKALGGVTTRDNGSHIMIFYKKSPPDMGDPNDPSSRHHY